jgi:hypothetical protein
MTGVILASSASISAPLVLLLLLIVVALLLFRASCGALGIALKRSVLRWFDISTAIMLLLLAVSVFWRFKVIG